MNLSLFLGSNAKYGQFQFLVRMRSPGLLPQTKPLGTLTEPSAVRVGSCQSVDNGTNAIYPEFLFLRILSKAKGKIASTWHCNDSLDLEYGITELKRRSLVGSAPLSAMQSATWSFPDPEFTPVTLP